MGLGELPDGIFDQLTALESLELSYNQLGELPDGIFDELTDLEYVGTYGTTKSAELPPGVFDRAD